MTVTVALLIEAINDATVLTQDAADESDLTEMTAREVDALRTEAEHLSAAVETYIEKAQPEQMIDN